MVFGIASGIPYKPQNTFYCVLLSLALFSVEIGLLGIISSSLLIYKINQDSKLLIDGSDICGVKGKPNGTRAVKCGNSCGLFTCPGFSLDKLDKEGTRAELCGIVKECTRGRFAAAGLALMFSLIQIGLTIYSISLVFVHRAVVGVMDFGARWCCFVIGNGLYLLFTLFPLILAIFFNIAQVPKKPNAKPSVNQGSKGEFCDENSIGILFLSWCGINAIFCLGAILLILYVRQVRHNPQDVVALYGLRKWPGDADFENSHESEGNVTTEKIVDADQKSRESVADSNGGNGFLELSSKNTKVHSDEHSFSQPPWQMILGTKKPAAKRRIEKSGPGSSSGSVEKGRRKRRIGRRKPGGGIRVSKV